MEFGTAVGIVGKANIFSCLLLITAALVAARPQLVDRIVAVAGEHPILYSEAREKVDSGPLVVVSDFPAQHSAARLERAINDLINLQLLSEALDELGAAVDDAEVEREIAAFLQRKGLNRADLDTFLSSQGKTYAVYRRDFKNQLLVRKFHAAVIVPMIKVTDEDIKTYYLKKSGRVGDQVALDLQQIFVPGKDKQQINEAHRRLQKGMPFDAAIDLYHSQGDATMRGVQLQELAAVIRNALRPLSVGQFSAPLETEAGQHIFLVVERRVSVDAAFAARKDELELELKQSELASQTQLWLQKRRSQVSIKMLYQHRLSP